VIVSPLPVVISGLDEAGVSEFLQVGICALVSGDAGKCADLADVNAVGAGEEHDVEEPAGGAELRVEKSVAVDSDHGPKACEVAHEGCAPGGGRRAEGTCKNAPTRWSVLR
jgi:hypothetical protein